MKMYRFAFVLALALVLALVGSVAGASAADGPGVIAVDAEVNGGQVELSQGELLTVRLEANPSTGFQWEIGRINGKAVVQVGETEFLPPQIPEGVDPMQWVGAPQTQILRFAAISADTSALRLVYHRPWETSVMPERTFSLSVVGQGAFDGSIPTLPAPAGVQPVAAPVAEAAPVAGVNAVAVPASLNWCSNNNPKGSNRCTVVKNQSSCGSCWAFAMQGTVEAAIKIRDGVDRDTSEQYLISCNSNGYSCNGGWWIYDYFTNKIPAGETAPGARYEAAFPYAAANAACNPPHAANERLASFGGAGSTDAAIKEAIAAHGPVSVAVCVGTAFQGYTSGVFSTDESAHCNGSVNHAVVLTGWDDAEGVWYLRNSWGPGWGEQGTMRIKYGTSHVGHGATYVNYNPAVTSRIISGNVRTAGGAGIGGVTVDFGGAQPSVTTNSAGFFLQSGFSNGAYTVTPNKTGYTFTPGSSPVTVSGADLTGINFTGAQQAGSYSITGYVRDPGGVGISGAIVSFSGSLQTVTTDNNGFYTRDGVQNGTYSLSVSVSGYKVTPATRSVTVADADVLADLFTGTRPTYSISGSVLDASGAPISGVTMAFGTDRPSVMTAADGSYTQTGFFTGHPVVVPSKSGLAFDPAERRLTISDQNLTGVNFTGASSAPAIRGVIKTAGGQPIAGVLVSFDGERPAVVTGADGSYVQNGFDNFGIYNVTPTLSGYSFSPSSVEAFIVGEPVFANFTGSVVANFYTISGTIRNASNTGIPGVTVSFGAARPSVTTDANGAFSQGGFPNGTYDIAPTLSGYSFTPASKSVTLSGANSGGNDFTGAQQKYAVSGQVTKGGVGLAGVVISLVGAGNESTTTNASGAWSIANLANSSFTVNASLAGTNFTPASREVVINGANVTGVNFEGASVSYCVSGYVRDQNETGLSGATVAFSSGGSATSTATGYYQKCELAYGAVTVMPSLSGYTFTPANLSVSVIKDLTNVNFVGAAPTFSVSGLIYDVDFNGLANVQVSFGGAYGSVVTDASGFYTKSGLASAVIVTPQRAGYVFDPATQALTPTGSNITDIIFSGSLAAGSATSSDMGIHVVTGLVEDGNGAGIPGVTMYYETEDADAFYTASVSTNAQGRYLIDGLADGDVTISAHHEAYTFAQPSILVTVDGGDVSDADFAGTQQWDYMVGRVQLQGHFDAPSDWWEDYPVWVDFYDPGTDDLLIWADAEIDASGYFVVSDIEPGVYDVVVKNYHSLSRIRKGVEVGPNKLIDFGLLREGDVDGDDNVWYGDYDGLAAAFGKCIGDAGFLYEADVDDSGCVWGYDFSMLAQSFGRGGDAKLIGNGAAAAAARASAATSVRAATGGQAANLLRDASVTKAAGLDGSTVRAWSVGTAPTSAEETRLFLSPPKIVGIHEGDTFTVKLMADVGSRGVDAIGAFLDFDVENLELVGDVQPGKALPLVMLNAVNNELGFIDYTAGRVLESPPVTGEIELARLTFRAKQSFTESWVEFDDADPQYSLSDAYLEGYSILDRNQSLGGVVIKRDARMFYYLPWVLRGH